MKKQSYNPVPVMDSVDALDLIAQSLKELKRIAFSPAFLARLREQKRRHQRALMRIIGAEKL